jgi:hypothetical protein
MGDFDGAWCSSLANRHAPQHRGARYASVLPSLGCVEQTKHLHEMKIVGAVAKLIEHILRYDNVGRKPDQPRHRSTVISTAASSSAVETGNTVSRGLCPHKTDANTGCSTAPASKTIVSNIDGPL